MLSAVVPDRQTVREPNPVDYKRVQHGLPVFAFPWPDVAF